MKPRTLIVTLSVIVLLLIPIVQGNSTKTGFAAEKDCTKCVTNPEETLKLRAPAPRGDYELVTLKGPGKFLSAVITKQGGDTDLTGVQLYIDGKYVVSLTIAAARNWGLTQHNPYGVVLVKSTGAIKTLTIGFPYPLYFKSELKLKVSVQEEGVAQILARVIHGK